MLINVLISLVRGGGMKNTVFGYDEDVFKMHIEDWEELYESHMGDRKWTSSVFHGIKNWYNYE